MKIRLTTGVVVFLLSLTWLRVNAHHDKFTFHIDCKFERRITELGSKEIEKPESFNIYKSTSNPSDSRWFTEEQRKRPGFWEFSGRNGARIFVSSGVSRIDPNSFLIIYNDKSAVRTVIQRIRKSVYTITEIGVCEITE